MLRSQHRACRKRPPPGADAIEHSPYGRNKTLPDKQRAQNHIENYLPQYLRLISINLLSASPFKLSFVYSGRTNGLTILARGGTSI